ncbi:MAG: hypothetical protein HYW70_01355 [Candidatus Nealsonbacteria bacterium]|nr:hypothetical protein [Candidatus Nealsonbacteria bacterium]
MKKKIKITKKADLEVKVRQPKILIVGIGGGGNSIVSELSKGLKKANFAAANTDSQALRSVAKGVRRFQFGQDLTRGLGCGMDRNLGEKCARSEKEKIVKIFHGADLIVLISCLGGGTGSGAAPEFVKIARDLHIPIFGIFTLPFKFEGEKKLHVAKLALSKLAQNLNIYSVIPNERIFNIIDKKTPFQAAFSAVNKILIENLKGVIEMIYLPGLINIDFADLRAILEDRGRLAFFNTIESKGESRAEDISKKICHNPLLLYSFLSSGNKETSNSNGNEYFSGEKVLFNIFAGEDLLMQEAEKISRAITDFSRRAKIIFGISQDKDYNGKIKVVLLMAGSVLKAENRQKPKMLEGSVDKPADKKEKPKKIRIKRKSPKSKKTFRPARKEKKTEEPSPVKVKIEDKPRRTALDIKKNSEEVEEKILEEEKKWDIPAFLRRKREDGFYN